MISCEQYDYIEIACMYRYRVKLIMKSGEQIECIAMDTARGQGNAECIKVESNGSELSIVLDDIFCLEVNEENPKFTSVTLN